MKFSLEEFPQIPRIYQPNQRDEERAQEKHNCLLFDNSVVLLIHIVMRYPFDENGHNSCCEKESNGVLQHQTELSRLSCFVLLELHQMVYDVSENEFVEEYDTEERTKDNGSCY